MYLTLSCILFSEFDCIHIDFNKTFILLFALVNTYVKNYVCVNLVQVYLFHFGWEGSINGNLISLV